MNPVRRQRIAEARRDVRHALEDAVAAIDALPRPPVDLRIARIKARTALAQLEAA